MRTQQRSLETQATLIAAVVDFLQEKGEADFRVPEFAKATDTSVATLYYHFGSREGLLDAAYIEIFRQIMERQMTEVELLDQLVTTSEQIIAAFRWSISDPSTTEQRVRERQLVLRVVSAAAVRPAVREAFAKTQDRYHQRLTEVVANLQDRSVLNRRLSASQLSVVLTNTVLSRAIDDLSHAPQDNESWADITEALLRTFLN
jgi:AcrR family transcriptional regulator